MDDRVLAEIRELRRRLAALEGVELPTRPSARVYRTTNQSIPNSTLTEIVFDAVRWDDAAYWSSATPGRLTVPVAGRYVIGATISFAVNATGRRIVAIQVVGATRIISDSRNATIDATTDVSICGVYDMAAGQYVNCAVFQTSGGALNVNSFNAYSPEFWIQRVG